MVLNCGLAIAGDGYEVVVEYSCMYGSRVMAGRVYGAVGGDTWTLTPKYGSIGKASIGVTGYSDSGVELPTEGPMYPDSEKGRDRYMGEPVSA